MRSLVAYQYSASYWAMPSRNQVGKEPRLLRREMGRSLWRARKETTWASSWATKRSVPITDEAASKGSSWIRVLTGSAEPLKKLSRLTTMGIFSKTSTPKSLERRGRASSAASAMRRAVSSSPW
ncbi:hypothetical protein D3C86_1790250 [compost metagenome]